MALMKAIATPPGKPTKYVAMTPQEEAAHLSHIAGLEAMAAQSIADAQAKKDAARGRLEAAGFNVDLLEDIKELLR